MAEYTLSATLELKDKFTLQINKAKNEFRRLSDGLNKTGEGFKRFSKQFAEVGSITNKVAKEMGISFKKIEDTGKVAAASFIAFGGKSYLGWLELEDQLLRNIAITRANEKEQLNLKKQVEELGATTRFTALEIAQAQMYQAMAGYKTNEILAVTPTLLKLSIATGEDLARTSDIITDSLSAFGLTVKDIEAYTDVLASTANNTNTTVGMMGNAFNYVGASSRALGEDYREVAVMLGILADNSLKGEKAGAGLNAMYARLAKPTTEMKKALKYVNLELFDSNGKFKGLRTIIEESKDVLKNLTAEQRYNWLTTIAGTEGLKIWTSIMNNSAEGTKKAEEAVYKADGAMDEFYDTMSKGSKQTFEEFKSALDGVIKKIGEGLAPIVDEKLKDLTKRLNDLSEQELSTENIEKFMDKIIEKGKIAAGIYAGLKLSLAGAAGAGAIGVSSVAGGVATAVGIGGTLGVYKIGEYFRDKYENSDWYEGDYLTKLSLQQELKEMRQRNKDKEFLKYNHPNKKLDQFSLKNPFESEKITFNLNNLTINSTNNRLKDTETLIEEVKERVGEEMRRALAESQMTQQ